LKHWEIITDRLSRAGWSWSCVSAIDSNGQIIFVADAHRGDGKRFIVRADEKLSAFVELERQVRGGLAEQRPPEKRSIASVGSLGLEREIRTEK